MKSGEDIARKGNYDLRRKDIALMKDASISKLEMIYDLNTNLLKKL